MSTYLIGESVSQKAIVGMFPSAASLIGYTKTKQHRITQTITKHLTNRIKNKKLFNRNQ
jgi:hypothetical protein